ARVNVTHELNLTFDAGIVSATSGSRNVQTGGLLRKLGGVGLSDIAPGVAVTNSGTIHVGSGALRIGNAAGGKNGMFPPGGGAMLEIAGGTGVFSGTTGNNGGL